MTGLSTRRATVDDIPAMSRILLAVRENVLSNPARITEAMYRGHLDALGRGWVAELDGTISASAGRVAAARSLSWWAAFRCSS